MKRFVFLTIALFFLTFGGQMALAEARSWELDKNHSNFYFAIDHIFSKIQGHFKDYSGEITFDPNNLGKSRFYFEIKTAVVC
jgi:polyisoprenoid-binding protein YceI